MSDRLADLTDERLEALAKLRYIQTAYYHGLALKYRRRGADYGELLREVQAEMMRRKWPENKPEA